VTLDMEARGSEDRRNPFERPADEIEIHDVHPVEAAVVRVEVPVDRISEAMGAAFREVGAALEQAGVGIAGEPFARYLSFGPDRIVAEVGYPVLRPAPAMGHVYPTTLAGGAVASAIHVGPYDTLVDTYARMEAWFAATGRTPADTMWEVYLTPPEGDPATWRTEICWPVA